MKKRKSCLMWGLVIVVFMLAIINIFVIKNDAFWEMSASSGITILIALVISYYLSQKNQDERKRKEIYMSVLTKLQLLVEDPYLFQITEETDKNKILMKKRDMNNLLTILKSNAEEWNVKDEIKFIEARLSEYEDFFSNHQEDLEYLRKSENELSRPLKLAATKILETMLKLFEF